MLTGLRPPCGWLVSIHRATPPAERGTPRHATPAKSPPDRNHGKCLEALAGLDGWTVTEREAPARPAEPMQPEPIAQSTSARRANEQVMLTGRPERTPAPEREKKRHVAGLQQAGTQLNREYPAMSEPFTDGQFWPRPLGNNQAVSLRG